GGFYGTTAGGGAFGHGTVFHVTGGGDVTLLHSFNSTDGSSPLAGLMRTSGGHLYGTTFAGGTSGSGVVFHISLAPGADFDGDGTSDVFWRNASTGQNIGWLMDGLTVSAALLPTIPD